MKGDDVVQAVDDLVKMATTGEADINGAFGYVAQSMFVEDNGDRPNAKNYVVLLTGKLIFFSNVYHNFRFP